MSKTIQRALPVLILFGGLSACRPAPSTSVATTSSVATASPATPAPVTVSASPEASMGASPMLAGRVAEGRVAEILNGDGNTYIRVTPADGPEFWAATSAFTVKPGDEVTLGVAKPVENHQSPSLGRTFDVVYFAENIKVAGAGTSAVGVESASEQKGMPEPEGKAPSLSAIEAQVQPSDLVGIETAHGGMTIDEILRAPENVKGQQAIVRGRVLEFNEGIHGHNWLSIADGSGEGGRANILVVTQAAATMGDLVVVTGIVETNHDIGGSIYPVLMTQAAVVNETKPAQEAGATR